jgi:Cytochrome c554 and c-prime/Doubled CXXCH motif (Paired_CXXCH_1)
MANPDPRLNPGPDPARTRRILLLLGCGFLAVVALLLTFGSPSPPTQVARPLPSARAKRDAYVGSTSCAECHPGEFASYTRSGHARTLRLAAQTPQARRLNGSSFADPERQGVSWSYSLADDQFWTERREGGQVERLLVDYAFGSGRHATTFVTLTNRTLDHPTMLEHRLSVYDHKLAPDITPGQGEARGAKPEGIGPSGRHYATTTTLKCFECHTTVTSDRGALILDEATMLPNVGCERCHGPAGAHVRAARLGGNDAALTMPFGQSTSRAVNEIQMCGSCHRLPETVDPALIQPRFPALVRFQPVGLMQSACYLKSPGALSCTTCHDPHARTSTDLPAYEAVCLSCHEGPSRTACKVSPATGCVGCHMPRRDATRGMMMTDHWIRSRPEAAAGATPPAR